MKVGIIGAGNVAKAHAKAIAMLKGVELVGAYDINYEIVKEQSLFKKAYEDYNDLVKDSDAIIIASPNHTHSLYALEVLKMNKHILCEKPMSVTLQQSLKMLTMSKEVSSKSCLGFNYRFLKIFQTLKKLINEDTFGEILSVELQLNKESAIRRKNFTWRDSANGGFTSGALGDLGIHLIDSLSFLLFNEIEFSSLRAKIITNVPQKENKKVHVDDYSIVNGVLKNGIYFSIKASKSSVPEEIGLKIKVIGKKKEFFYESKYPKKYFLKSKIIWEEIDNHFVPKMEDPNGEFLGWQDSFLYQMQAWKSWVEGGSCDNVAKFSDGYYAQTVLMHLIDGKAESPIIERREIA